MTTITVLHPAALRRAPAAGGLLERLRRAWAEWRLYARTRDELAALGDRELADLGISRYDIDAIARSTVHGA